MYDDFPDDEEQKRIEAELYEVAKKTPIKKRGRELRKLISQRRFIMDQRLEGRPVDCIVELLAARNVHVSLGTARNYIPQIERAVEALALNGNTAPSHWDVYEMVTRLAAEKSARSSQMSPSPARNGLHHADEEACQIEANPESIDDLMEDGNDSAIWDRFLSKIDKNDEDKNG